MRRVALGACMVMFSGLGLVNAGTGSARRGVQDPKDFDSREVSVGSESLEDYRTLAKRIDGLIKEGKIEEARQLAECFSTGREKGGGVSRQRLPAVSRDWATPRCACDIG